MGQSDIENGELRFDNKRSVNSDKRKNAQGVEMQAQKKRSKIGGCNFSIFKKGTLKKAPSK